MANTTTTPLQKILKNDSKAYLGIFAVSFIVFLLIALLSQVMTLQWRSWLPGAEGEKSLIGGVKGAVYTFMSNLI
jgi:light-harvesting complex 1 beta chain